MPPRPNGPRLSMKESMKQLDKKTLFRLLSIHQAIPDLHHARGLKICAPLPRTQGIPLMRLVVLQEEEQRIGQDVFFCIERIRHAMMDGRQPWCHDAVRKRRRWSLPWSG